MEAKANSVDKWQVALEEVQALHKIPLPFPNQIDLHSEGKDVVPNKNRRGRDCGGNKNNFNCFCNGRTNDQISCSTANSDETYENGN